MTGRQLLQLLVAAAVVAQLAAAVSGRTARQFRGKKCPRGFQLVYDRQARKLSCECRRHHLYWPATGLCYPEFAQGPCRAGNRLALNTTTGQPYCRCPAFWSRYVDGTCHEDYTRGPCPDGQLLVHNATAGRGVCRCDASMLMHYFSETRACYPKYSQGPCNNGHIIQFDYRRLAPRCVCRDGYEKWSDGSCYKVNTVGPCDASVCGGGDSNGTACFTHNLQTLRTECSCLRSWARLEPGSCYQPYLQAPCPSGQWLVPAAAGGGNSTPPTAAAAAVANTTGAKAVRLPGGGGSGGGGSFVCRPKKHCTRFDNWFYWPATQRCYRQFSRGPCPRGRLFYMDPASGEAACRCRAAWRAYYWPADGGCYEQHSVGPCARGMFFGYNFTTARAECRCFKSHVFNAADGTCVERYTSGACPPGQLITADAGGRMQCACSPDMTAHYWRRDGRCYEHYKQGPCQPGQTFRIDQSGGTPDCVVWQG